MVSVKKSVSPSRDRIGSGIKEGGESFLRANVIPADSSFNAPPTEGGRPVIGNDWTDTGVVTCLSVLILAIFSAAKKVLPGFDSWAAKIRMACFSEPVRARVIGFPAPGRVTVFGILKFCWRLGVGLIRVFRIRIVGCGFRMEN